MSHLDERGPMTFKPGDRVVFQRKDEYARGRVEEITASGDPIAVHFDDDPEPLWTYCPPQYLTHERPQENEHEPPSDER